jgi:hypothetical protein
MPSSRHQQITNLVLLDDWPNAPLLLLLPLRCRSTILLILIDLEGIKEYFYFINMYCCLATQK